MVVITEIQHTYITSSPHSAVTYLALSPTLKDKTKLNAVIRDKAKTSSGKKKVLFQTNTDLQDYNTIFKWKMLC